MGFSFSRVLHSLLWKNKLKERFTMRIKMGKVEADIPALLALFGLLVADNLYANHCKKKALERLLKESGKLDEMAMKKEG
jgi:hypothetical protein